jgi:hypothetical protein
MPPWVRSLQQAGAAGASPSTAVRMLLPREATVSLEPGTADEPVFVAAVNPRGMGGALRTLIGRTPGERATHAGQTMVKLDPNLWVTALDGTFLVGNDLEAVGRAVERLRAPAAAAPRAPIDLGAPARRWDVTGTIGNRENALVKLLWKDEPAPDGVERARIGIDMATSDLLVGRVVVECDSPTTAAAAAAALRQRAAERAESLADKGLALRVTARTEGPRAVLDWEMSGLDAAVSAWVATSQQRRPPA